ncbi:MAG: alpha/beta hydrolase [Bacteroidota bacterium]|nr:alpha/beta hydrolase [Bacteroidota bacterium]
MRLVKSASFFLFCFCSHLFSYGQNRLSQGDHFAMVNGIRIHYYVRGKGPVCLLPSPGWGPSIGYLKSTLQPLENYFKIVYYDTRMSGQSAGPADTTKYTSKDFMDDMDSLRIYLNQQKVWIMGHSAGGFQVLNYGIHHNDHLKGIIVLDGIAGEDSLRSAELTRMVLKRIGQPYYEKGTAIIFGKDTTNYSLTQSIQYILPFYFHDLNKMNAFLKLDVSQMSEQAHRYTTAAGFDTEYLFPNLGEITVPTLVVVGDDDFICDKVSQADRIVKNISSSSEMVIKNAGHFSWFENPKQFYYDCGGWLKKQGIKKKN